MHKLKINPHQIYQKEMFKTEILNQSKKDPVDSFDMFLRTQAQMFFFKLAEGHISEEQMRIGISKAILSRAILQEIGSSSTIESLKSVEQLLADNMTFLKTIYPEPKNSLINRYIFEEIKNFDELDKVEYDMLSNLGISYESAERAAILEKTQTLLNQVVTKSQETLPSFTSLLIKKIPEKLSSHLLSQYESIIKQSWKFDVRADVTESATYRKQLVTENLHFKSSAIHDIVFKWVESLSLIVEDPHTFLRSRKYLKLQNGTSNIKRRRAYSKGHPRIFKSPQRLNQIIANDDTRERQFEEKKEESFFQSILRKLKEVCQSQKQQSGFQTLDSYYIGNQWSQKSGTSSEESKQREIKTYLNSKIENYEFKSSGYPTQMFLQSLEEHSSSFGFQVFKNEQTLAILESFNQTIKIVNKNNLNHRFTPEQKMVYSCSQNCHSFLEQLLLQRLIKVLVFCIQMKKNAEHDYKKSIVFQDVDLISFSLPNLLQAKIHCSQKMILSFYKALEELNNSREIRLARVENKLFTAEKELIITLKIKSNPILCTIKLILETPEGRSAVSDRRQWAFSKMNEFFRQAEKSLFGPISFFSSTIKSKDHRSLYLSSFKSPLQSQIMKGKPTCHCGKSVTGEDSHIHILSQEMKEIISPEGKINLDIYRKMIPGSFVCGVCEQVINKGDNFIPAVQCNTCFFKVCLECSDKIIPDFQKNLCVSLIDAVVRIVDSFYYCELELRTPEKMSYNHQYNRDTKMLIGGHLQERRETHFHIVLQGQGFTRFGKGQTKEQFCNKIKRSISLRNFEEYQDIVQGEESAGILFRPSELLKERGQPFLFLHYEYSSGKISKFITRAGQNQAFPIGFELSQIEIKQNDFFIPILWLFGESLVIQYITRVLRSNPFSNRKLKLKDQEQMHFSKRRISSQYLL